MTRLSEGIYRIERGRVFVTVSQIIIKYIGCESVVLLRKGTLVAGGLVVCRLAGLLACRFARGVGMGKQARTMESCLGSPGVERYDGGNQGMCYGDLNPWNWRLEYFAYTAE